MGLFSKIFGNSDEPTAPGGDGTQVEPSKGDERDTSPPARAASRPVPPSRDDARAPREPTSNDARPPTPPEGGARPARRSKPPAGRSANAGAKASPPEPPSRAEAVRAASAAVASPRPSVPPKVEAKLLSSSPVESSARAPSAPKQPADATKQAKRAASPPPVAGSAVKAVATSPTRAIGTQPLGTPEAIAAPTAARKGAPPARSEVRQTPPQAEPLELDSVAPPRGPLHPHDDVDSAFARIVSHAPRPPGQGTLAEDPQAKKANAELFSAMAGTHARPIKDFLLELLVGPTSKQWIDVARPAAQSIQKAATELGQPELVAALTGFNEALENAAKAFGTKIEGAERDGIIRAQTALSAALPQAFDLVKERGQREPLVVRHLLLQVPGVHKVTIDKLYAAGLASLDALCRSSIDDLVQLGRLEREGADAILSRFRQYWNERASQPVHKAEEKARKKLATLLEQLGLAHEAFQRAEADEDREKKRDARGARRASSLAINVLLAQLGEVDLVEELERSPTERRIERVRSYVDQMVRARPSQHQEAV